MYSLYADRNDIAYGVKKFIVDTVNDLQTLPNDAQPGSSVFVIGTSKTYMLGSDGECSEVAGGASGGNWSDFNATGV